MESILGEMRAQIDAMSVTLTSLSEAVASHRAECLAHTPHHNPVCPATSPAVSSPTIVLDVPSLVRGHLNAVGSALNEAIAGGYQINWCRKGDGRSIEVFCPPSLHGISFDVDHLGRLSCATFVVGFGCKTLGPLAPPGCIKEYVIARLTEHAPVIGTGSPVPISDDSEVQPPPRVPFNPVSARIFSLPHLVHRAGGIVAAPSGTGKSDLTRRGLPEYADVFDGDALVDAFIGWPSKPKWWQDDAIRQEMEQKVSRFLSVLARRARIIILTAVGDPSLADVAVLPSYADHRKNLLKRGVSHQPSVDEIDAIRAPYEGLECESSLPLAVISMRPLTPPGATLFPAPGPSASSSSVGPSPAPTPIRAPVPPAVSPSSSSTSSSTKKEKARRIKNKDEIVPLSQILSSLVGTPSADVGALGFSVSKTPVDPLKVMVVIQLQAAPWRKYVTAWPGDFLLTDVMAEAELFDRTARSLASLKSWLISLGLGEREPVPQTASLPHSNGGKHNNSSGRKRANK